MWFPRRSSDQTVRTSAAAFPRRPVWDTVGGPSAAPHRISRILSGTDVESIPPFIGFCGYSGCSRPQGTVLGGGFPTLSYRTERGVSIPARGVHGFLLRHLRTCRDFRFSEARVRAATLLGSGNHDAPKRSSVPLPFAGLRCLPPGRGGPLAPASSAPASAPSRERSAHRTRIEAGPQGPSANGASLLLRPHPSVPCASCGCGKSFS